jgi:hypothetical protein
MPAVRGISSRRHLFNHYLVLWKDYRKKWSQYGADMEPFRRGKRRRESYGEHIRTPGARELYPSSPHQGRWQALDATATFTHEHACDAAGEANSHRQHVRGWRTLGHDGEERKDDLKVDGGRPKLGGIARCAFGFLINPLPAARTSGGGFSQLILSLRVHVLTVKVHNCLLLFVEVTIEDICENDFQ